jgi:uridine kinase
MERAALLEVLADRITGVVRPHPIRVAIDGVDGVGKTTLANELVDPIRRRGVPVIRASIDGFHHPRSVRYRRGRRSPEGYFRELRRYWDFSVFLDAPFEVTSPRYAGRDGSSPDVNAPENRRYVEGQKLYLLECEPKHAATVVINNDNLTSPEIIAVVA